MSKEKKYQTAVKQIKSIFADETDIIANLANCCAILKETFNFFWVGFYFIKNNELILGPFQGPLACTRIQMGRGVCGKAAADRITIIVADVHKFDGHIACNSNSKSEIVIPLQHDEVIAVLDIDSDLINQFDEIDKHYLEEISSFIVEHHFVSIQ